MPLYFLLVTTRPVPGEEAEYHRWYDRVHLAEVLRLPGFLHAQRFQVEATHLSPRADETEFVAIYTISSDDIDVTVTHFDRARSHMESTASLQPESVSFRLLRSIAEL